MASWYGDEFNNKLTASGDVFDQNALTAAHKTLPLPSMVRVTNLENNKTIIVMVNDRGPFSNTRLIDVSKRTAQVLGFASKGVAKVRVQYLPGQTKRLWETLPDNKPVEPGVLPDGSVMSNGSDLKQKSQEARARLQSAIADTSGSDQAPIPLFPEPSLSTSDSSEERSSSSSEAPKSLPHSNKVAANAKPPVMGRTVKSGFEDPLDYTQIDPALPEPRDTYPENIELGDQEQSDGAGESLAPINIYQGSSSLDIPSLESHVIPAAPAATAVEPAPSSALAPGMYIQVGTYSKKANADRAVEALAFFDGVHKTHLSVGGKSLYRVRVGPLSREEIAQTAMDRVIALGYFDAMITVQE
jgi:rare lipoprotein A